MFKELRTKWYQPPSTQNKIFEQAAKYHKQHHLSEVYYMEVEPGVHCLYDTIFQANDSALQFIHFQITKETEKQV